jgi:hypothetical protein
MSGLLSVNADAKTTKGQGMGYLTGILYLAPHQSARIRSRSGEIVNVCPFATKCKAPCLVSAGRGAMSNVQRGRVRKTRLLFKDRAGFVSSLGKDIGALVRKAERQGMTPTARLNGTSDLGWESYGIMGQYPDVQFYDYTKSPARMRRYLAGKMPPNYHLTFSWSGTNASDCADILQRGGNVAVPFSTPKGRPLPELWSIPGVGFKRYRVIDGDKTDLRFLDPRGVIVGLRAKGKAKHDASGFTVTAVNVKVGG